MNGMKPQLRNKNGTQKERRSKEEKSKKETVDGETRRSSVVSSALKMLCHKQKRNARIKEAPDVRCVLDVMGPVTDCSWARSAQAIV